MCKCHDVVIIEVMKNWRIWLCINMLYYGKYPVMYAILMYTEQ